MSNLKVALDWDGVYVGAQHLAQVGLLDQEVIGGNIQTYLAAEVWLEMVQDLRQGRSLKRLQQHYTTPIGLTEQFVDWEVVHDRKLQKQLLVGTVSDLKLIEAADVTRITLEADICTDSRVKLVQNKGYTHRVPEASPMTLHESLHLAAHNAFRRLPLLTHKEILETSTFEATDKIRICCESEEDVIALHEGRWDIAGCAVLLYPQTEFELYYADKNQQLIFYKGFSMREASLAGELQRREVQIMIEQVNGNGHSKGLLVPNDLAFTEIYNSVLFSPDTMTLVTEAESKPIIVSRQYAKLTQKTVSYWVGAGSINKAGWAPGELEQMQRYLERDGYLQNYEYKAYLHDYDEVTTWYTSFQRVFCDGEWMRVAKVLDIVKANLAVI